MPSTYTRSAKPYVSVKRNTMMHTEIAGSTILLNVQPIITDEIKIEAIITYENQ